MDDTIGQVHHPCMDLHRTGDSTMTYATREAWLEAAADELRPMLEATGNPCPAIRVSVGWPRGSRKAVGQCWSPTTVRDHVPAVFISPVLEDAGAVLETLLHEMTHAAVGCEHGHKAPFSRCAKALGFTGPWTNTPATPELQASLAVVAETLGEYPHAAVTDSSRKKQGTRMLKLQCGDCGYTVRTTAKWLAVGYPSCPDGDMLEWVVSCRPA